MSRLLELNLTTGEYDWQTAAMPGANQDIDLVRLDSTGSAFAILGRFPAGFERLQRGGYEHAEEFIVLDGYLELEGVRREVGDLTLVPPNFLRTRMSAPDGCTVLAWFGGPPIFQREERLLAANDDPMPRGEPIRTVSLTEASAGEFLVTPEAIWTKHDAGPLPEDVIGDSIDLSLTRWRRLVGGQFSEDPYVTRIERSP